MTAWIKVEVETPDKPEVQRIAALTGNTSNAVVGALIRVWSWAQNHTTNGVVKNADASSIDDVGRCSGLASAMSEVGWIRVEKSQVFFPQWNKHNGSGAKKRALDAKRASRMYHAQKREIYASDSEKKRPRARFSKEQEQEKEKEKDTFAFALHKTAVGIRSECANMLAEATNPLTGTRIFNPKAAAAIARRIGHDTARAAWGIHRLSEHIRGGQIPNSCAAWVRAVVETVEPPADFRRAVRIKEAKSIREGHSGNGVVGDVR